MPKKYRIAKFLECPSYLYVLDAGGHAVGQVLRVGRGAEAVHLEIVSTGVEVEIVSFDEPRELSHEHDEQKWSEDRALGHTAGHRRAEGSRAVAVDRLRSAGQVGGQP